MHVALAMNISRDRTLLRTLPIGYRTVSNISGSDSLSHTSSLWHLCCCFYEHSCYGVCVQVLLLWTGGQRERIQAVRGIQRAGCGNGREGAGGRGYQPLSRGCVRYDIDPAYRYTRVAVPCEYFWYKD